MQIESIILGVVIIWCLFYLRVQKWFDVVLLIGLICMFLGVFFQCETFGDFSINVLVCIGNCLVVGATILIPKKISKTTFLNICFCLIIFGSINLISIEFSSFFNSLPLILVILLIHVINFDIDNLFQSVNLSLLSCEIFNALFMFAKMNYVVVFSDEFIKSFVFLNFITFLLMLVVCFIRRKYEKGC